MWNKYTSSFEIFCNKVVAEIIAPTDEFVSIWNKKYDHVDDD